ncbi:MAG: c-type cytochrome [Pseudomonadota bacterium]
MSKSPNTFLPALGVTGIVLGAAYGINTRSYKAAEAELALKQAAQAQAQVEAQAASVSDLQEQILKIQSEAEERVANAAMSGGGLTAPAPALDGTLGLGRAAHVEEIAAWDVDVLPDGRGLPVGSGNAYDGEEIFADQCAACHGDFAEGVGNWPVLAGGFDTLADEDPVKTVGSYWPHLSTAYDYIYRSMPFGAAGTLTPDDTYAIVAYILYSNDLIDDEFELSNENLGDFEMYNADGFVVDDRPELEYAAWRAEPCMENCKDEVEISMRSVFLVETPPEGGSNSVMNESTLDGLPSFTAAGPSHINAELAATPVAVTPAAVEAAPVDNGDALAAAGKKVFAKCKSCHQIGANARNGSGPHLTAVMGRPIGAVDGFKYSKVFQTAGDEGRVWSPEEMAAFLAQPKDYMKGTKMSFRGLNKPADIEAIIAYLQAEGS